MRCILGKNQVVEPFLFENRIINADSYLDILQNYFILQLKLLNLKHDALFQQGGAPWHFALRIRRCVLLISDERCDLLFNIEARLLHLHKSLISKTQRQLVLLLLPFSNPSLTTHKLFNILLFCSCGGAEIKEN